MLKSFLFVGIGSFFGGIARYGTGLLTQKFVITSFPLATFIVNVIGCLLIGLFFGLSEKYNMYAIEWRLLLITGFCGGFTTFSAFSIESMQLLKSKAYLFFSLNVLLSVIIGFAATFLGYYLVRLLWK